MRGLYVSLGHISLAGLKPILRSAASAAVLGVFSAYSAAAFAQAVSVGQLGAAQSFDRGPLTESSGGLDAGLWQGLSAQRASLLIEAVRAADLSELPYRFFRRVLLSEGVPPQGDSEGEAAYIKAAVRAKLNLGDYLALESLSGDQSPLQRDPIFRVERALASGDIEAACNESDREIDNRSAPFWMQMRIMCHLKRDEIAAAELTLNLMRDNDEADTDFVNLAEHILGLRKTAPKDTGSDRPILTALQSLGGDKISSQSTADYAQAALSSDVPADVRLAAMFKSGYALSPQQVTSIMSELQFTDNDLVGGSGFDIDTAISGLEVNETRTRSTAQLYTLANNLGDPISSARAVAALLTLSQREGFAPQMTEILSESLPFISSEQQAELGANLFAWAAVRRGDLSALGGLYRALDPESPLASRIALASDALGNGFVLGRLGLDIETRLGQKGAVRKAAIRDTLIALALGAQLSDDAAALLQGVARAERIDPLLLAQINSTANANARAGTLLYVINAVGEKNVDKLTNIEIYSYISALSKAGLTREAGELAAFDFLSRIPS